MRVSVNLLNILQVLQFMVDEKLPKEIAAKKLELQVYEDVINEKNINKQYLNNLQSQVSPPTMHPSRLRLRRIQFFRLTTSAVKCEQFLTIV